MLTWVKGFLFGLVMALIATIIGLMTSIIIEIIRGDGVMVSIYFTTFVIWVSEVETLEKLGKIPFNTTRDALCSRIVFFWVPICLGWYIAINISAFAFWAGLIISSTFVGYQMMVTQIRKNNSGKLSKGNSYSFHIKKAQD